MGDSAWPKTCLCQQILVFHWGKLEIFAVFPREFWNLKSPKFHPFEACTRFTLLPQTKKICFELLEEILQGQRKNPGLFVAKTTGCGEKKCGEPKRATTRSWRWRTLMHNDVLIVNLLQITIRTLPYFELEKIRDHFYYANAPHLYSKSGLRFAVAWCIATFLLPVTIRNILCFELEQIWAHFY